MLEKVEKLMNKHNMDYVNYIADNPNLEDVEFEANRYWNDTLTEEQAKWLDKWQETYEQIEVELEEYENN